MTVHVLVLILAMALDIELENQCKTWTPSKLFSGGFTVIWDNSLPRTATQLFEEEDLQTGSSHAGNWHTYYLHCWKFLCQHYSALQFEASPRIWAVRPSLSWVGSGQPEFLMDRGWAQGYKGLHNC